MTENRTVSFGSVGVLLIFLGAVGLFGFGFAFDTSVETKAGGNERVVNIGKVSDRQSGLVVSGVVAIIGAILLVGHSMRQPHAPVPVMAVTAREGPGIPVKGGKKCPYCGLISPASAQRCDCGFTFRR